MAQFYFLSVLLNILIGLVLVYGKDLTQDNDGADSDDDAQQKKSKKSAGSGNSIFGSSSCFENKSFRLVLGVLSLLVSIMVILSPFRNDVPVIGDLLPALAGLFSGASLLVEYYITTTTEEIRIPQKLVDLLVNGRKYIGVTCLVAGLLHFIFPQVPIL